MGDKARPDRAKSDPRWHRNRGVVVGVLYLKLGLGWAAHNARYRTPCNHDNKVQTEIGVNFPGC